MKPLLRTFFVSFFVFLMMPTGTARAEDEPLAPDQLVHKITTEILEAIQNDKELQAGDRKKALALAEEKVLPNIDFVRMTQLATGRHWRRASKAQQEQLVTEFRSLLVRTYARSIRAYRGQTMKVDALIVGNDKNDVVVRNSYLSPGNEPVAVEYRMAKAGEAWKVYDIVVEGISLVTTFRSTFQEEVRKGGIDGLIARLAEKNR